jgi:hypothetical protein
MQLNAKKKYCRPSFEWPASKYTGHSDIRDISDLGIAMVNNAVDELLARM